MEWDKGMIGVALAAILIIAGLIFAYRRRRNSDNPEYRHHTITPKADAADPGVSGINPAKPPWVRREIIRLAALMPEQGGRKIAETFNRLYADARNMTVGKTWVCEVLRDHQYDIQIARRNLKHRKPKPMPKNRTWATDLTTVTDENGRQNLVLGVIDHGTRACLALHLLESKHSLRLVQILLQTIKRFGKPKSLRTDNEAVFTSGLFRSTLKALGIRHQRSDKHCPWQNGRVERFFGTFKSVIRKTCVESRESLNDALPDFRFWYNHIRTHDHLDGHTPAEKWDGRVKATDNPRYFESWGGVLAGFYFRD